MKRQSRWKKALWASLIVVLLVLTGCAGCSRIPPGEVGIIINLAGDDRGVDDMTVETGWVFYNPMTKDLLRYPTYVHTHKWEDTEAKREAITFNSGDGLSITADVSMAYSIEGSKVPQFYVTFRHDDLSKFTDGFMRNEARSAFQDVGTSFSADQIYGPMKGDLVDQARAHLQDRLAQYGVIIQQFDFIGAPRPPASVLEAIERRVEAVQKAETAKNELQLMEAEAAKKVATAEGDLAVAKLEAEKNRALSRSIDKNMIDWKQLELTEIYLAKWDGDLPNVIAGGEGSGMLFQLDANR